MRRQQTPARLTDAARAAIARVPGCWGEHLRRCERPVDEGGCTVSCSRETTVTRPMRWSNSKSGSGWPRRSQSGIGSGVSSQADGPRAGAIGGGRDGSPMWVRIRATGASSAPELGSQQGAVCRLWRPCYPPPPRIPRTAISGSYRVGSDARRVAKTTRTCRRLPTPCMSTPANPRSRISVSECRLELLRVAGGRLRDGLVRTHNGNKRLPAEAFALLNTPPQKSGS